VQAYAVAGPRKQHVPPQIKSIVRKAVDAPLPPVLRQNWRSAVVGHDRECLRRQSPYDRDGLTALTFRDGVRTVTRVLPSTCGAVDELTSGGASFVAVVQAADFRECHEVTLGDVLHASGRWRVFRQREMGP
jgi:hypothetical protein